MTEIILTVDRLKYCCEFFLALNTVEEGKTPDILNVYFDLRNPNISRFDLL